jgi:DNA invertase Pin-like site-specific DNA recombinase
MNRSVALIYVRVSRLDEEERARKISPEMQRDKALALREVAGLTLVEFEDLDLSGKSTENRPGYRAMMERLEAGDVRYVVAYDQSRITRNVGDLQRFREALARHGARFIEASTGRVLDPDDEDQELGSNEIGSVDQHYRLKLARRVRGALGAKVARGEFVGLVPAGYVRQREILPNGKMARTWVEIDPETAPTIRTIFAEYATGTYSFASLARALKARGLKPPRRADFRIGRGARPDGSPERAEIFSGDVVKDLLTNPRYVGRIPRRDGSTFPAACEPLIDEETWNACQRVRMQHRSVRLASAPRRPSNYLLSGLLRCSRCGSTMSGQTFRPDSQSQTTKGPHRSGSHRAPRYRYTCYLRRVAGDCDAPSVPQAVLEHDLLEVLRTMSLPEGVSEDVNAAVTVILNGNGQNSRGSSLKAIVARLERLRDLYELGDIERDEYLRRRAELETQREAAKDQAGGTPSFVHQHEELRTIVDDWETMTIDERRQLISIVLSEVRADEHGLSWFRPQPKYEAYVEAVVPAGGLPVPCAEPSERKTGLLRASCPREGRPVRGESATRQSCVSLCWRATPMRATEVPK